MSESSAKPNGEEAAGAFPVMPKENAVEDLYDLIRQAVQPLREVLCNSIE